MAVWIDDSLTESDAWLDMSPEARALLIAVWSTHSRELRGGTGESHWIWSVACYVRPRACRDTVDELAAHGWIEANDGGWTLHERGLIGIKRGPWERLRHRRKIPAALRSRIYARDGMACLECGATDDLTLDHIHPWSLGGTDDESNLRTLCRRCNARKGARI